MIILYKESKTFVIVLLTVYQVRVKLFCLQSILKEDSHCGTVVLYVYELVW